MVRHPLAHVFKRPVCPVGITRDLTDVAVKAGRGKRFAVNLLVVIVTLYSQNALATQLLEGVMEPTDPSKEINKLEPAAIHDPSLLAVRDNAGGPPKSVYGLRRNRPGLQA